MKKEKQKRFLLSSFILQPSSFGEMPQRLAAAMSLVVFALCLLIGGLGADNSFGVAVGRALVAMAGTYAIALVIGLMAKRMIEENVAASVAESIGRSGGASADASTKSQEKSEAK